ncbi:uncharacterized protein [Nicotiana tomentosiformis]|uniref:uncharacterized protein n=1 Tax=Nicotiana tomentosiformis TaxID=4098 RepID=UPI00388C7AC5
MTVVYAKCSSLERLELWDNLYYLASDMELLWVVGRDFNVILNEEEKIGGLPVYPPEFEDYALYVNSCELFDTGYTGSPFTWWNGISNKECIFKRLDRIFVNQQFNTLFPSVDTTHESFNEVVKQNWIADFVGDHFLMFKQKIKRLKDALSHWSKLTFGDIFKQLEIREDIVRIKEIFFEEEPTNENRILEDQEGITYAATTFFQTQFTEEGQFTSSELINNVPSMISNA